MISTQTLTTSGNQSKNKPSNKTLSDGLYYLGAAIQAADNETEARFLTNHIKKPFPFRNAISTTIEYEKLYIDMQHKPSLLVRSTEDQSNKEVEGKKLHIYLKEKYFTFIKRKKNCETNTTKADKWKMASYATKQKS
jgi:hypothetical protein